MHTTHLAVNGTLMRGLALNANLHAVGAIFIRQTTTAPVYRLWSIADQYPAMMRVAVSGAAIAVEIWALPVAHIGTILLQEPPGLCIGNVQLADGTNTLGVLGEPLLCESGHDISAWGGWRAYRRHAEPASE